MDVISAPFIRTENRIRKIQIDYLAICAVMLLQATFNYGYHALAITAISIAASVFTELLGVLLFKKSNTIYDLTAVKSGAVLAMLLPATVPLWVPAIGGVLVGMIKIPFLSRGASPFIPEAFSISVLSVIFSKYVFSFVTPLGSFDFLAPISSYSAAQSAAGQLMQGSISPYSFAELFLGIAPGTIGSTLIALTMCGLIYLTFRDSINFYSVGAFFAGSVLISALIIRGTVSAGMSILNELTAGSVLFCGIMFFGDKYTSPKNTLASLIYGFVGGVLCIATRDIGLFEETAWFVVVIMGLLAPLLDKWVWKFTKLF